VAPIIDFQRNEFGGVAGKHLEQWAILGRGGTRPPLRHRQWNARGGAGNDAPGLL
jgi:hypothetical protein